MAFKRQAAEVGMVKKVKSMKIGKDEKLDQAVFVWFKQKRAEGALAPFYARRRFN